MKTMFDIRKDDEREEQLMYELQDHLYEMTDEDVAQGESETVNSFIKRMNRLERKRRKTSRQYPGTLSYNALRHAVEYMDNISIRRRAPEKIVSRYLNGGYTLDMIAE